MSELIFETASKLAKAIINKERTSVEIVKAHFEHIEKHNQKLNAIITLNKEEALKCAYKADSAIANGENWGPLHGVPITIKDTIETANIRTTAGHKPLLNYIPKEDATVVARLRKAGAIIIGKTNTPMLAQDIQCENTLFGSTKNPWNNNYTPGGSSGGEAAAIASGISPLGIGSDIGGSLRIPSHYCGLFSLKPTEGLVPKSGHIPPMPGTLNPIRNLMSIGPLARSVEDLRVVLKIIAGPDYKDRDTFPVKLNEEEKKPLNRLKFLWLDTFEGLPITSETHTAINQLVKNIKNAGCTVEKLESNLFKHKECWKLYGELFGHMSSALLPLPVRVLLKVLGPILTKDIISKSVTSKLTSNSKDYLKSLERRDQLSLSFEKLISGYDGFICPAGAAPAFLHRKTGNIHTPIKVDDKKIAGNLAGIGYTCVFNLTGHPVVTLPLTKAKNNLPIGVQLVGSLWEDMRLLNSAETLSDIIDSIGKP